MIRNLLATTAAAALLSTGAFAQDATQPAPAAPAATDTAPGAAPAASVQPASGHLATNLIGENVYNGAGDKAEKIGDVNDFVLGEDGMIQAVIVGVGGFLGIGEKNVALEYKGMKWAEQNGDEWLVVETSKEALEALPEFDRGAYGPAAPATATNNTGTAPADQTAMTPTPPADNAAPANNAVPADQTAQAPATTNQAAPADQNAGSTDATTTAAIDKSTLSPFDTSNVRSEDLVGTTVYGANDENVGEIGDVVMSQDGKVDAIIIDVGGFLGMGEKEVAVGMDNLSFLTDKDGNKYLYTNMTKEQLESQAAYDESTWAEHRDTQRMVVR